MRILGIFAHPDDAEIWAGGVLIKHGVSGHEVLVGTFPQGDQKRSEEAKLGARVLGATTRFLNSFLTGVDETNRSEVMTLLEEYCPSIIITHWFDDTHPQHRLVFELVSQCVVNLKISCGLPEALFACDTYNSIGVNGVFQPSCYVDISDVWDQKLHAIDAHKSQSPEIWKAMISIQAQLHGARIGRKYAEAFFEVPVLGRYRPNNNL